MRCRPKRSPLRRKLRKFTAIFLVLTILSLVYIEIFVKTQLKEIIIREVTTLCEQAVNTAVEEFLEENMDIDSRLTAISSDSNGAVRALTTDALYLNYVKTSVTDSAQEHIDSMSHDRGIGVPLGCFTGFVALSNVGPPVYFEVDSAQTVSCEFESSFASAGLNQTVHHITMTVYVDLFVFSPFKINETVSCSSTYEIAQTVIVGNVPSYSGFVSY